MQNDELQNQIDFLMSVALRKCDNLEDARDLTQETLLAALAYRKKGAVISNTRGWLLTVFNRKYYDMLRIKYKLLTMTIGEDFDIIVENNDIEEIGKTEEAEAVRREVAYLSEMYRTIISRHYFSGESVEKIAADLDIPVGTVKSRLDFGRKQMKKGLEAMESYTENSYLPKKLHVCNSGRTGIDDEPMSLVPYNDILTQNILILSYEKPVTITELGKAIGIPAAYIEPVINKLVHGELMKRMGDGKIYTDFIIYDDDDNVKYIREQEKFAADNAGFFCNPMIEAIEKLKQRSFYNERLERFIIINIAQSITWDSLQPHIKPQIFPDRPNGGKWIAFGTKYPENYLIPIEKRGKEEYMMSGERTSRLNEYLNSKELVMHSFETSLYRCPKFDGFGYKNFNDLEEDMLRLFYLIKKDISPETVGFTQRMLKNMPIMQKRGMIEIENGKPNLLIPCLTHEEYSEYVAIKNEAVAKAVAKMTAPMGEYIKDKKKKIPVHLKSVPDQKLIMPYEPYAMCLVYEAINRGVHKRDLGYPCPETIVVID